MDFVNLGPFSVWWVLIPCRKILYNATIVIQWEKWKRSDMVAAFWVDLYCVHYYLGDLHTVFTLYKMV